MSLNRAMLIGRLGKDPELTYTQSGTARCRFSLATSEVYFDNNQERQEKTEWHNIIVWGKQAESAGKYLEKGREVFIEGSITTRSWEDEKTGQKRYITEIKAQRVVFLGSKPDGGGKSASGDSGGYTKGSKDSGGYTPPSRPQDDGPSDDDIPF